MSIKIRKFKTGGYEVDVNTHGPDGVMIRERVKSPITTLEPTKRWAMLREAHLALEHGSNGCRCKVRGEKREGPDPQTITVKAMVESWIEARKKQKIPNIDVEEQRLRAHVLPLFGRMKVIDVRPRDAYRLVQQLSQTSSRRGGVLAPRTIRGIFFTARQVFQHAVLEEWLQGNPMVLKKGVLPSVVDKFPKWRSQAVFTADEVEQLISDEKIAPHRRVAYAIEFLTGLRTGQVSALRWGDYEADKKPLGRMTSSVSWDSKHKEEKATKTHVTHETPVHPVLAKVLAGWKLAGWQLRMKRQPKPDDLIIPTINNTHRDVRKALEDFHEDLERLGLRKRRHYDARRTFISLGLDGGASKDILQSITHPRPADAFDLYRTPAWTARCEAVTKIGVQLREGKVIQLIPFNKTGSTGELVETNRFSR